MSKSRLSDYGHTIMLVKNPYADGKNLRKRKPVCRVQRKGVIHLENFADMVIEQCLPAAWENLIEILLTIWNEDYPYIIAFFLFALLYFFLNKRLKKKHSF